MMRKTTILVIVTLAACASDPAIAPTSDAGTSTCPPSHAECDGNPSTVCETRLDTDPRHCGACGVVCPPGNAHQMATCSARSCGLSCEQGWEDCDQDPANGCEAPAATCIVATIGVVDSPGGLAIDPGNVFFASKGHPPDFLDGKIYRLAKAGGLPNVLAAGQHRPLSIALDAARVYWTNGADVDQPNGSVSSVGKNGVGVTVIANGITRPANPVVDGDRIYWTSRDPPTGTISSARKDGTDRKVVVTDIFAPSDLQIHQGWLVWATSGVLGDGSDAVIERAKLDGTERTLLAKGIPEPSFNVAFTADAVLVGSRRDGTLRSIPFSPATQPPPLPAPLFTGLGQCQETHAEGDRLFITTGNTGKVVAVPLPGGALVTVAADQKFTSYLASDDDYLYWTDGELAASASIKKLKKPAK